MNVYSAYRSPTINTNNRQSSAPLPTGFWASQGGAFTRSVQPNELTSTNLNSLIAGNSDYIQQARNGAMAAAAARGLGNSSYASGNAQGAAIRAALPIAQADAQAYGDAAHQNEDVLNQILAANNQNSTSRANANTAAAASRYGADQSRIASEYGQNAETERQREQNQFNSQFQPYMLGLQNQYGAQDWARQTFGNILQGAYGTMFSNPDYFNNPDAAMGFINGFGNFANNQIGQFLYGDNTGGAP